MINELLQWSVLLLVGFFVIGLTRQLGHVFVSQREHLADEYGPEQGTKLPTLVLGGDQRTQFRQLFSERGTDWGLVAVVSEACDACDAWLELFESKGSPGGAPLAVLTGPSKNGHVDRLRGFADIVVFDASGGRLREANLVATPFLIVVDERLKVRHKQIGGSPHEGVATWRAKARIKTPRSSMTNHGAQASEPEPLEVNP